MPEPSLEARKSRMEAYVSSRETSEPHLEAGRVGRSHGLDGSFYVTRARPRLLREGASVLLDGEARLIVRRGGVDERPIVRLEGVEDRTAAEALRGRALTVARADAPALEQNEWWASDLEGCEVRDSECKVGVVLRLLELPSCEALEVRPDDGREPLLIPMVRDAIRSIDVARHTIDVDMGFVEGV